MSHFVRTVGIPILVFLVGWNLGVSYVQRSLPRSGEGLQILSTGSGQTVTDPEKEVNITLLWQVWRLLQRHYIEPQVLDPTKMVMGAVSGLTRAVGDPYTVFMPPEESMDFRDSLAGKLEGIGAELSLEDGLIVIVAPLKGSPAEKIGLLPDDVITEVNDQPVEGLTLNEVVQRIRGEKGTTVKLTVVRQGEAKPLPFSIVRQEIHVPSVESRIIASAKGSLGYVALNQFGEGSIDEVRQVLRGFATQNVQGLILDLRGNGGGYLEGAVELASLFLEEGRVVTVEQRDHDPQHQEVQGNPIFLKTPLVVLQNQVSASASEIAAGALQDHGRAVVIGMQSYGKGTVQEVLDLPGGSSLRVTVARWLTPKGKDLSKEGVHPDHVVDRTAEDYKADRDPQLDAAIEFLETGKITVQTASSSSMR